MKQLLENIYPILIWVVVIGAVFAYSWRKGYLKRLSGYMQETRDELKGSTVVVMVAIVLLGAFTIATDFVITLLVRLMT